MAGAAFVDLDRTLLRRASGPTLNAALVAEGMVTPGRSLPGDRFLYQVYDLLGENLLAMSLARAAALMARGWSTEAVQRAGERAVGPLTELLAPLAPDALARFRAAGLRLVLSTTTPDDLIAPFAASLGFDGVIATRYEVRQERYTGRLEGGFVWGVGKLMAARRWARAEGIEMAESHACSDSLYDVPLLASVGFPHAVNADLGLLGVALARRWPIEHWDRSPGVPSLAGLEPYHLFRPLVRPQAFPYARFDIEGVARVPRSGPVILAANHRSYFDVAALALVAGRIGRPVRFLAKRELFEAPVVGCLARAFGGIPVDRGSGSRRPLQLAEAALKAGEVVIVLPQGTIPRGEAFFDPVLRARTGVARMAADSRAPVIPVGLWGTERVWPRSARLPDVLALRHPPLVTVRVGPAVPLGHEDMRADSATVMAAIAALLPKTTGQAPSLDELARTSPSGRTAAPANGHGRSVGAT